MSPNWYPGHYLDPKHWPEWMPEAFPHWLPASLVRTPPVIPPASWPEPSSTPSYGLFDELPERLRPKSYEEHLAALDTLLPPSPKPPEPQSNPSLWGGLLPLHLGSQPAQWPDASSASTPPSMATPESLPQLLLRRQGIVPVLGVGTLAKIAGWPDDVPVLPVQHTESANYWGAAPNAAGGPLPNPYLSPVPPAPDWEQVPTTPTANEAEIFAPPPSPLSWGNSLEEPSSFDEAAAAEEARRAAAMRLGQWRRRGTQEYEPPPQPPPAPPVEPSAEAEEARRVAAMKTGQWGRRGTKEYEGYTAPPPAPQQDELDLRERTRLNFLDSFYRGGLSGAGRLALLAQLEEMPDDGISPATKRVRDELRKEYRQIVADLERYDRMPWFQSPSEFGAAALGRLSGGMLSPESFVGLGAKGGTWLASSR